MWLLTIHIQHISDCDLMHYGWGPLLLYRSYLWATQCLYLAMQKQKMRKVGCVSHGHIWTSLIPKCAFAVQGRAVKLILGGEGGVFWDHTWGLAGITPGTCGGHTQGHRMSELCAQVASFLHWLCTFSVAGCALQPTCAFFQIVLHFFQIVFSPFSPHLCCFQEFLPLLRCPSVQYSCSSFHFFREQLEEELGAGVFNLDKRRLRGTFSL